MAGLGDILVLGLGSSGCAATRYCCSLLGTEADSVTVIDTSDADHVRQRAETLGALGARVLLGSDSVPGHYDLCIASPGIPPHAPVMAAARNAAEEVISEVEFAYRRSVSPWVAITGTNGKTTTTALVTHLLNSGGVPAVSVGNIGTPAIEAVASSEASQVLVAEVSSFQMALSATFHPRVAVLLNITPDHIDWHGSMSAYVDDKTRIFANLDESDVAVVDVDDEGAAPFARSVGTTGARAVRVSLRTLHAGGAGLVNGVLTLDTHSGPIELVREDELAILGRHNVSNALAAAAAAHAIGVSAADLREGLRTFLPIEHRLEPSGVVGGAEWFNDSKATNPDAVFKAVAAFDGRPLVVLMGGRNKRNDFLPLALFTAGRAREVIVFGEAAGELEDAFVQAGTPARRVAGMADAVRLAAEIAQPGDAVILSPACASFDEFSNYEERGRQFKALVGALAGGES